MVKLIPAGDQESLFLVRDPAQGRLPLSHKQIARLLSKWSKKVGLDPSKLTPHCLRRGGLNWAHKAKLTGETLQVLGGWASEAYKRYIDHDFHSRVEAGKQMANLKL